MSRADAGRGRAARAARIAALWLAAALISGFTLRRYLGPLDEGILMQAATRMGDGQWPWRDFGWPYGPGQPLLVMLADTLLGPSLVWWRLLRVAADATAAVLVYALVRDHRPRRALPAWAAAAVTAAQPVSANPTAPALALALAAILLATRGRPAWAGAAAAVAAFWRPDLGVVAALAAAATLGGAASAGWGGAARRRASSGDAGGPAPAAAGGAGNGRPGLTSAAARTRRPPAALSCLLTAALLGAVLYAPFVIAAGPAGLWDALVAQAGRDGEWWRLPFPAGFAGGDLKDVATWLAPYAALALLALAVFSFRRTAGLVVLGAFTAVYFLSRADLEHAQALLVVTAALAALVRPKLAGAAVLALLLVVGAANRASALLRPPDLRALHVNGAEGIRVAPADAAAIPRVVARVQRLVPPGEPIYVAPRRSDLVSFSNPLLHFLTDRPNVLHRDVLLQAKPAEQERIVAALRRTRPRAIVRWTDPASARPEPNRRGRPSGSRALDDYLASAYELSARFGAYDVLVPR